MALVTSPKAGLLTLDCPFKLRVAWFAQAPRYESDIYTYVWQPHISNPEPKTAQILVSGQDRDCYNVLVQVRSKLQDIQRLVDYCDGISGRLSSSGQPCPSALDCIAEIIYEVYSPMIEDTSEFLDDAHEHLADLVSRPSPSQESQD